MIKHDRLHPELCNKNKIEYTIFISSVICIYVDNVKTDRLGKPFVKFILK